MLTEELFNMLTAKASEYKYSSLNYVDFEACKNAEILVDELGLILLQDKSKSPTMLYFATNDFEKVIKILAKTSEKIRIHFVPRSYAQQLKTLGFSEWGEYVDFWNRDLLQTVKALENPKAIDYLSLDECEKASNITKSCTLQSRGFEGDSKEAYETWLNAGNNILTQRESGDIVGVCSVSIYNEGTTLWIKELAVEPRYQRLGLGKKLIEQAINYGIKNGAVKGFLAADVLNETAISLYKKYDFLANDEEGELQMIRV